MESGFSAEGHVIRSAITLDLPYSLTILPGLKPRQDDGFRPGVRVFFRRRLDAERGLKHMRKRALLAIAAAFSLTGTLAMCSSGSAASAATAPHHSVSRHSSPARRHKPGHHSARLPHRTRHKHRQHAKHRAHCAKHHGSHPQRHACPRRPKRRHSHPKRHARPKSHPRTPLTPRQLARRGRWQLDIPGIGVRSRLLSLGDPRGPVLSVPALSQASEAAWYNFSAVPGTPGNAVLVGHVDTYSGPAVFYDLYRLRHGEPVYVTIGGRRVRFAVQGVTEVQKDLFPVSRIFGATNRRRLWIITCGGAFDYTTRHYMDNIIVSASYQPVRQNRRH